MLFWFCAEVLEDAPLPDLFHVIPVLDKAVVDGIIDLVRAGIFLRLIANEEV